MNASRELVPGDLVRMTIFGITYVDQVVRVKHRPGTFEMVTLYVFTNPDLGFMPARILGRMIESGEASVVRLGGIVD